jgi:hypothetical protein
LVHVCGSATCGVRRSKVHGGGCGEEGARGRGGGVRRGEQGAIGLELTECHDQREEGERGHGGLDVDAWRDGKQRTATCILMACLWQ